MASSSRCGAAKRLISAKLWINTIKRKLSAQKRAIILYERELYHIRSAARPAQTIFPVLYDIFPAPIRNFSLSAQKKFVTKFVTHITKFVTRVSKFVIRVTKFVIKIVLWIVKTFCAFRKKILAENKKFNAANSTSST